MTPPDTTPCNLRELWTDLVVHERPADHGRKHYHLGSMKSRQYPYALWKNQKHISIFTEEVADGRR